MMSMWIQLLDAKACSLLSLFCTLIFKYSFGKTMEIIYVKSTFVFQITRLILYLQNKYFQGDKTYRCVKKFLTDSQSFDKVQQHPIVCFTESSINEHPISIKHSTLEAENP